IAQREIVRAQIEAETVISEKNLSGLAAETVRRDIVGQAMARQAAASQDVVNQAVLQAAGQERLAVASGISSSAVREATVANQAAAFEYQHGAGAVEQYRAALERAAAAEVERNINATVLQLTQQTQAAERLAAVESQGAAAAQQAAVQNQAITIALQAG